METGFLRNGRMQAELGRRGRGVEEDEQEQGEDEEEGGGSGGAGWVVGSLDGWLEGQETGGGMPGSEAFKVAKLPESELID